MFLIMLFFSFSLVILIYELGRFLSAKICNVGVEEFSFGMGNRVFSKEIKNTTYSICSFFFGANVILNRDELDNCSCFKKIIISTGGISLSLIFSLIATFICIKLLHIDEFNLLLTIKISFSLTWSFICSLLYSILKSLVTLSLTPVIECLGLTYFLSVGYKFSLYLFLDMFSTFSLSIVVFNLIPTPITDSGNAISHLIESFSNKRSPSKAKKS